MARVDEKKWDCIYRSGNDTPGRPAAVLTGNSHLLPETGTALDAACGKGANAVYLARHGLQTQAWDISQEALDLLIGEIESEDLDLSTQQRDIVAFPPEADTFDVIVVTRFLDRSIIDPLIAALRQNGLIFYQTFIKDKRDDYGPKNPDYRLDNNELLRLFSGLHIIYYREEGTTGDLNRGFRNEAMLIARKM